MNHNVCTLIIRKDSTDYLDCVPIMHGVHPLQIVFSHCNVLSSEISQVVVNK